MILQARFIHAIAVWFLRHPLVFVALVLIGAVLGPR